MSNVNKYAGKENKSESLLNLTDCGSSWYKQPALAIARITGCSIKKLSSGKDLFSYLVLASTLKRFLKHIYWDKKLEN